MKTSTLIGLAIALMLAVSGSVWLLKQDAAQPELLQTALLGDFEDALPNVTRIDIQSGDQLLLRAQREGDEWQAFHLSEYARLPVDFDSLSGLIDSLKNAQIIEAKTSNPENYARLGVEPVNSEDAQSHLLQLKTDTQTFTLLVGKQATSGLGSFVRLPDNAQSWQINQSLVLPESASAWLQNPIPLLSLDSVSHARLIGQDSWEVERVTASADTGPAATPWKLVGQSSEEKLLFPNILQSTLNAMLTARFEDVVERNSVADDLTLQSTIVFDTDKESLSIDLYKHEERYFASYQLASSPWLKDWLFELSSFTFGQLNKQRFELLTEPVAEASVEAMPDAGDPNNQ
ncbi:DUF4340 domain-containing protein [Alteromonas facilis]|uniref:DUF4340 domain-containing protein n=1 Tax=Alteromonas facilis TaxID=2048004 RepID=UPI000C287843|nr:DUF4340 domain-containing protein [Alteromonas facilis]